MLYFLHEPKELFRDVYVQILPIECLEHTADHFRFLDLVRVEPALDVAKMVDDDPRRRSSRDTRQALTVALVKPGRGSCWNQAKNSSSAML
jgi:hypothetical protein